MPEAPELRNEDGTTIPGYLVGAKPEALIVVHEVFGLNNQIRGVARRYAAEGFTTFAIDLFDGRVTDDDAVGYRNAQLVRWKACIERIRTAVQALSRAGQGSKVGILGFSFGGAMALAAASHIETLRACVAFYGIPTAERGNLAQISCKVQCHFGNTDMQNSRDRVDALVGRLTAAGVSVELNRYHTGHFFFNETRKPPVYSPHNSQLAFARSIAFLKRELSGGW